MKLLFLLIWQFIFKCYFSYQLVYEKNYGASSTCVSDMPTAWKTIEGTVISSCVENCTQESNGIYSRFISYTSTTQGLVFSYNANNINKPYSIIGADILYFQTGGTYVNLSINDQSPPLMVSSPPNSVYEEKSRIICPDYRTYLKATVKYNISALPSGNLITVKIQKESTSQHIGIRYIRIWTNCRQNCVTCQDSNNCNVCQTGFKKKKMPTNEVVCEQTNGCTIANCQSCFKGDSTEICSSCLSGYTFDGTQTNCIPLSGPVCTTNQYLDQTSTCVAYTTSCQYFNRSNQVFQNCSGQEDFNKYKCLNYTIAMIYDYENYSIFQCGCPVANCKKCSNTSSQLCDECFGGYSYNFFSYTCDTVCAAKQYYNTSNGTCIACPDSHCDSCSSSTGCDQCSSGYTFNAYTYSCVISCAIGQYYDNTTSSCKTCPDSNCLQCSTSTNCNQCKSGFAFSSVDQRCNRICTGNQYLDSPTNTCVTCPDANCLSCSSSTVCNSCASGYTYSPADQRCNKDCLGNQYFNSPTNTCITCPDANCLSCSSSTVCTNCATGYTYSPADQRCNKDCLSNQYFDSPTNTCINCPDANCLTCSSSTLCTNCKSGYTYSSTNHLCNLNCSSGQYFDTGSSSCVNCTDTNCLQCSSSTVCSNCKTGYTYNSTDLRCNKDCLSNEYYDHSANNCITCPDVNCLTCSSSTVCTNCKSGYTYNASALRCNKDCLSNEYYDSTSNNCFVCPDTNCLSCSSSTVCTNCKSGFTYNSTDQRCNKVCLSNEYYDHSTNTCIACPDINCFQCSSSTICTNCSSGYTYNSTDQRCNKNCLSNEYYNHSSNVCITCPDTNCLSCSSSTVCNTCKSGYTYSSADLRCNKNCLSNEYFDSPTNSCLICPDTNCLTCSSSTVCTNCQSGYTYNSTDQRCNKNCLASEYYNSATNSCITCGYSNCLQCSSSSCIQCQSGYTFNISDNRCNKDCLSNQYFDSLNNTCIPCSSNCISCTSSQCKQCKDSSYFIDQTNLNNCVQCSVSSCLTCQSGYSNKCSVCQQGYQVNQADYQCVGIPCNVQNCVECDTASSSSCKICNSQYKLASNNQCQKKITQGTTFEINEQEVLIDGYTIIVEFSKEINPNGFNLQNLIEVQISNTVGFKFKLEQLTNKQMKIKITSTTNIKFEQITIIISDDSFLQQNNIEQKKTQQDLKIFVIVPEKQIEISQQITQVGNGVSRAVVATMLPIVILSNFYILINTIDITGFLYYLLFINIRHPYNVIQFYSIFKDFQFPFIPNFFDSIVEPNYIQQSPPKFMEKGTDRYFIKNTGQTITIWIIIIAFYVFIKILSQFKIKLLQNYLIKAIDNSWEYSAFFDLLWNTYIYPLVGVLLQFCTYDFGDPTNWVNYSLHSIFAIITLSAPFYIFFLIYKQKDIKNNPTFLKKYSTIIGGIKLFCNNTNKRSSQNESESNEDLKPSIANGKDQKFSQLNTDVNLKNQKKSIQGNEKEENFYSKNSIFLPSSSSLIIAKPLSLQMRLTKYYNPLLYFRKLMFGLIIVYGHEFVYFQLILISFLNLVILIFLIAIKPLESKHENIKSATGEVILILIQICAFFLVEDNQSSDENQRLIIGWVIVGLSSFVLLWHTSQLIFESLKSIITLAIFILKMSFRKSSKIQQIEQPNKNKVSDVISIDQYCKTGKQEITNEKYPKQLKNKQISTLLNIETNVFFTDTATPQLKKNQNNSGTEINLQTRRRRDRNSNVSSARIISDVQTPIQNKFEISPQSINIKTSDQINTTQDNYNLPVKQQPVQQIARRKRQSLFASNFTSQALLVCQEIQSSRNIQNGDQTHSRQRTILQNSIEQQQQEILIQNYENQHIQELI